MESNTPLTKKPGSVRTIFILNAIKILLSLGFYCVFAFTEFGIEGVDPNKILITTGVYALLFGTMVYFILNRNVWGVRIAIILDFAASVPLTAVIGMVIAVISFFMTFRPGAKAWFVKA